MTAKAPARIAMLVMFRIPTIMASGILAWAPKSLVTADAGSVARDGAIAAAFAFVAALEPRLR